MKRKKNLKQDPLKTIDPAMLKEILGSVPSNGGAGNGAAVIRQEPFNSFFHS